MTRWASTSWLVHSVHRLGLAHCAALMPRVNSTSLVSLSRNGLADSDTEMLLQKGRLIGEQRTQQRWMVDLEVITVVVPHYAARRRRGDIFSVARVNQRFPTRYSDEKRCLDFRCP